MIELGKRLSGVTEDLTKKAAEFDDTLAVLNVTMSAFGLTLIPTLSRISKELLAATENANGFRSAVANFFAISGSQASEPVAALAEVDAKLVSLRKTSAELAGMSALKRFFSGDDIAIVNEQIERAERARQQLLKLQPPVVPPRAVEQFADEDGARGALLSGQAARFLEEPKEPKARKAPKDNSAEQEARAQLEFDLSQIRKAGDSSIAEFARAQRIMEARRSAALIDEKDYFAARLGFIQLNSRAAETALQEEIGRLQREKFTGDDAVKQEIDNARKVADAQARLQKVRADAVADAEIVRIQETGANNAIARSYLDATKAADAYIASISRRNAVELSGVGRGSKFREQQAGQFDIESRLTQERQRLEGELRRNEISRETFDKYLAVAQDTYRREVDLYVQRTLAIEAAEANWLTGAQEALANYADAARDVAGQTEDIFGNAFKGLEDLATDFITKGKADFKSFAQAIHADITRAIVRQSITGPLAESLKDGNLLGSIGSLFGLQAPQGAAGAAGGAGAAASITAAATTFSASVASASVAFSPPIVAAGTTFAASVTAAGSAFAASVAAASAASSSGEAAGGIASLVGSFATGTPFVPETGLALVHKGERIVPAAENAMGGGRPIVYEQHNHFHGPQDRSTVAQGLADGGRRVQRELARGTAG